MRDHKVHVHVYGRGTLRYRLKGATQRGRNVTLCSKAWLQVLRAGISYMRLPDLPMTARWLSVSRNGLERLRIDPCEPRAERR